MDIADVPAFLQQLTQIIGPLGAVIVLIAWWAISRRAAKNPNGSSVDHDLLVSLNTKMDSVEQLVGHLREDVQDIRERFDRHLEAGRP